MSNLTVAITAQAVDANALYQERATEPVTIKLELAPEANSHGEAIVRALRHASDVAAARFGCLNQIEAPPAIGRLIYEMADFGGGRAREWAVRLAAEYGLKLTDESD